MLYELIFLLESLDIHARRPTIALPRIESTPSGTLASVEQFLLVVEVEGIFPSLPNLLSLHTIRGTTSLRRLRTERLEINQFGRENPPLPPTSRDPMQRQSCLSYLSKAHQPRGTPKRTRTVPKISHAILLVMMVKMLLLETRPKTLSENRSKIRVTETKLGTRPVISQGTAMFSVMEEDVIGFGI
jgi:hypothetical protein